LWVSWRSWYSTSNPASSDSADYGSDEIWQYIEMMGRANVVLNTDDTSLYLTGVQGSCNMTTETEFDPATTSAQAEIPFSTFSSSPICVDNLNTEAFGYDSVSDGKLWLFALPLDGLMAAVTINVGLMEPLDNEVIAIEGNSSYVFNGTIFNITRVFDERQSNRDFDPSSIFCLDDGSARRFCGVILGSTFTIPIFNHFGASYTIPTKCANCDQTGSSGVSKVCDEFNFLSGFLYFNVPSNISQISHEASVAYSMEKVNDCASFSQRNYNTIAAQSQRNRIL
jgi:hypothetical protein